MLKIARTAKQIFSGARNLGQTASASINSMVKYSTQSKRYVEDASGEFTFERVVPNQSLTQDKINSFNTVCLNAKPQPIDWHAIRELIYARFADEIASKPNNVVDTDSHDTKEYVGVVANNNIADEFKELKRQGYNFQELRDSIVNHNSSQCKNIEKQNGSHNGISKSVSERMKEIAISGYMSRYSGESCLREEIEAASFKKELVIHDFMARFVDEIEAHSIELLG